MQLASLVLLFALAMHPLQGQQHESEALLLSGALRKSGLPEGKESVTIPLVSTFAGFTVEVTIDGKAVQLLLDTGCSGTTLSPETAERLGLEIKKSNRLIISPTVELEVKQVAQTTRISVGDAWTVNEPVDIMNLPDGTGDGLLGMGTLADWDVRIDPVANELTLFPGGKAPPLDGETVVKLTSKLANPKASASNPHGFRKLVLSVPVGIGNHEVSGMPDTGYGGILSLPEAWMMKHAPDAVREALPALLTGHNISGPMVTRSTKLPVFKFGPDTLHNLPTKLSVAAPGADAEGRVLIGLNLLRHYVMTFRFSAGELRLKPLGTVQDITLASTAGLSLNNDGVVLSVAPNGAGAKVGLRAGDQLLAIEGLPLKTMKPAELAAFKQLPPGTTVKIRYQRGAAEPAEVNLVLIKE